jgi:hypothetical protein
VPAAIKRFVLAVHDDVPGKCLENEITRRIFADAGVALR